MNAREIFIVARYEFLVISRGVVFRVLTLLALLGVTWLQVALQGTGVAYSWTGLDVLRHAAGERLLVQYSASFHDRFSRDRLRSPGATTRLARVYSCPSG